MGWKDGWSSVTPLLVVAVLAFSWGDILFGIDTAAFGSLQVLPAWLNDFADYNEETGEYVTPSSRSSIMNAIVFVGAFAGCAAFEPITERWGFKITIYVAGALQVIAVILELTAQEWVQFTVGRVIAYAGVGLVENASPGYCSEISPAALRGFMSGSMTVLVTLGNTIGASVAIPFVNEERSLGWMIPVAIQFLPAVGIFAMVPFCPESPRWLVSKGRDEQALKNLNRLRPQRDVQAGLTVIEIEAVKHAVEESRRIEQGQWIDLFNKKYRRRTMIVLLLFLFYQTTGGQFVNVYGPTFYRLFGLGDLIFTFAAVGHGVGVVATLIGILLVDRVGRRPLLIFGATVLVICNFVVGTVGPRDNLSTSQVNGIVACMILILTSVKISFQANSFLMTSEMGGVRMRKKFMGFGTSIDVIYRFVFILVIPYLLQEPLNMGARFAYVMGFFAACGWIFAVFFVPETKGRSLEEMDELFDMNLWAWQFNKAETKGVGRRVADVEHGMETEGDKPDTTHLESPGFSRTDTEAGPTTNKV